MMRRWCPTLAISLVLGLMSVPGINAQGVFGLRDRRWQTVGVGTLAARPATCIVNRHVYICNGAGCLTSGEYHYCSATNTWTVASGAGTITAGTDNQLPAYSGAGTTLADADCTFTMDGTNVVAQCGTDSVTGYQYLDADGGTPILNIDTTNERLGIGIAAPLTPFQVHVGPIRVGSNLAYGAGTGYQFGDGDTEWGESADDTLTAYVGGSALFAIDTNELNSIKGDASSPRFRFAASAENVPAYTFSGENSTGMYRIGTANMGFSLGGKKFFELGGSQTALCQDTTSTTGDTLCIDKAGAGETGNISEWHNNAGTVLLAVPAAGGLDTTSGTVTFADFANVASATTTTLTAGNLFHITGTTNITTLNTCGAAENGRLVTLIFDGILTFTDGNNLKLAGNFATTADDTIQLLCDGTNWYETGTRSVN